jgi:glycogen(starch) synthase
MDHYNACMSVLVLSLSDIPVDPRVHRTCVALVKAGFHVTAVGLANLKHHPENLPYTYKAIPATPHNCKYRIAMALRQTPANVIPSFALKTYHWDAQVRAIQKAISNLKPLLIYANDLNTLPIAAKLKQRTSAKLIYDTHEFATGEGADRWLWRFLFQTYRKALESQYIHAADQVITVSDGIAKALAHLYRIAQPVLTVRNIPLYQQHSFRPVQKPLRVLYHGLFLKDRGLESLIESVPLWQADKILHLRGYGAPTYEAALKAYAAHIAPDRIIFEPAVATHMLTHAATDADIGILPFPTKGIQKEFSLPNKLFEYMMAGLAIISTPCHDISKLIAQYETGVTTKDATSQAIAQTINALTTDDINRMKAASLQASQHLCWEVEQQQLLKTVHMLIESE